MARKQNKKSSGPRKGSPSLNVRRNGIRCRIIVPSFNCTQGTGLPGCLTSALSGIAYSNVAVIPLNVGAIGGRLAQLAEVFQQWRARRLAIRYRTALGSDGALPNSTVISSLAAVNNRICFGVCPDPAYAPVSYQNAVEYGGTVTSVRSNANFRADLDQSLMGGWRYCQSDSTATTSQARFADIGTLYAYFNLLPTSLITNSFGDFEIDLDVEFRFPQDNVNTSPGLSKASEDEKKVERVPPLVPSPAVGHELAVVSSAAAMQPVLSDGLGILSLFRSTSVLPQGKN
jgi:hypothetical protein